MDVSSFHPVSKEALQRLVQWNFVPRWLFGDAGSYRILELRRVWIYVADVVHVYNEWDAQAYRGPDLVPIVNNIPDFDARSNLLEATSGTLTGIVANIEDWPIPEHVISTYASSPATD